MWNRLFTVGVVCLLAACATASPVPTSAPMPNVARRGHAPPPTRTRLDATNALLRAGTADAITAAEARALFGPPDVDRRDGIGALQVWTLPSCALTLGFANDRLRTVEPGPRRTGDATPSLQACIAEARTRGLPS